MSMAYSSGRPNCHLFTSRARETGPQVISCVGGRRAMSVIRGRCMPFRGETGMRHRILSFVLLAGVLGACFGAAEAATVNALSCSVTDVANAVAAASNGDTVNIPAGDCTWTSQLT